MLVAHLNRLMGRRTPAFQCAHQCFDLLRAKLTPFEPESHSCSTYNLSIDSNGLTRVILGEDHLHLRQGGDGDGGLDECAAEADVAQLAPANGAAGRLELDAFVECVSLSPPMFHVDKDAICIPGISSAESFWKG